MAGQAIPALIAKWKALDFAMKASVIGGIAAVVLAAAVAFQVLSKDMSAAAQAARAVENTQKQAASSIALERAEIDALSSVAKNETASKAERLAAMDRLIEISPTYRSALNGETIDTGKLESATNSLVDSLLRAATARKAVEDIAAIDEQLRGLKDTAEPTWIQTATNAFLSFGSGVSFATRQGKDALANYEEQRAALETTRARLMELAQANVVAFGTTKTLTKNTDDNTKSFEKNADAIKKLNDVKSFKSSVSPQISGGGNLPTSVQSQDASALPKAITASTAAMSDYLTISQQFGAINLLIGTGVADLSAKWTTLSDAMLSAGQVFAGVGLSVVASMEQIAASGGGLKEMAAGVLGSLKKVIGGLIKTGVTAVVTKALLASALNPFAALALGAASGALAQGLFNALINKIKIPALAEGGVLTGPRMVLAGEYAGARTNPEIVTPENKMRDVFREVLKGGGGIGGGQLVARVSGDDLLFIVEKAQSRAGRKR